MSCVCSEAVQALRRRYRAYAGQYDDLFGEVLQLVEARTAAML